MVDFLKFQIRKLIARFVALKTTALETVVAIFELTVVVVSLRGHMRGGEKGEEVTLLYVGRHLNLPQFKKKFFSEITNEQSQKTTLLTYRKHMDAATANADVLFVDIGWPYNKIINRHREYLQLPDWVCMVTRLEETWEDTVQNFRKTMRKNINRLIRKNGYRCEATNDPAIISRFYDDYYASFINSRHAGEVFMTPRSLVEQRAREGTILQVVGSDGPVAAGVYFPQDDEFALCATGMPEELVEHPAEAAMSALYFFSLRYAFDHGYKAVNFMGTRAFPDDGLFQFKRKWGAVVKDDYSIDAILFKPMNNNPRAARFCEFFPMVARRGESLELIICTTAATLDTDTCERLVAGSHCGGIDTVKIVHVTDNASVLTDQISKQLNIDIISTSLGSFAEAYKNGGLEQSSCVSLSHKARGQVALPGNP